MIFDHREALLIAQVIFLMLFLLNSFANMQQRRQPEGWIQSSKNVTKVYAHRGFTEMPTIEVAFPVLAQQWSWKCWPSVGLCPCTLAVPG